MKNKQEILATFEKSPRLGNAGRHLKIIVRTLLPAIVEIPTAFIGARDLVDVFLVEEFVYNCGHHVFHIDMLVLAIKLLFIAVWRREAEVEAIVQLMEDGFRDVEVPVVVGIDFVDRLPGVDAFFVEVGD